MASKHTVKFFRTFLAIGFLFVLAGLTLLLTLPAKKAEGFLVIFHLALMFGAAVLIYIALLLHKGILLYFGLNIFIYSVGATFVNVNVMDFSFAKLWPLLMISFGITLVPSGYLRFKKMRTIYLVPAAMLCVLGILFSLFAFDIITIPFRTFFMYMWPAILLCAGLILIVYYFYSTLNKEKFMEETDDSEPDEMESLVEGDEKSDE